MNTNKMTKEDVREAILLLADLYSKARGVEVKFKEADLERFCEKEAREYNDNH